MLRLVDQPILEWAKVAGSFYLFFFSAYWHYFLSFPPVAAGIPHIAYRYGPRVPAPSFGQGGRILGRRNASPPIVVSDNHPKQLLKVFCLPRDYENSSAIAHPGYRSMPVWDIPTAILPRRFPEAFPASLDHASIELVRRSWRTSSHG